MTVQYTHIHDIGLNSAIKKVSATLVPSDVQGKQLTNQGQTDDVTLVLPPAQPGYSFCVVLSTTVAKYYRLDPNGTEVIYLQGTACTGGHYVGITSAVVGACISLMSFYDEDNSAYAWLASVISGTWVEES